MILGWESTLLLSGICRWTHGLKLTLSRSKVFLFFSRSKFQVFLHVFVFYFGAGFIHQEHFTSIFNDLNCLTKICNFHKKVADYSPNGSLKLFSFFQWWFCCWRSTVIILTEHNYMYFYCVTCICEQIDTLGSPICQAICPSVFLSPIKVLALSSLQIHHLLL